MRRHNKTEEIKLTLSRISIRPLLTVIFISLIIWPVIQGQPKLIGQYRTNIHNRNVTEDAGNYRLPSVVDDEYLNFQPFILQPKTHATPNYTLRLDSLVELRSEGFSIKSVIWHYYYNNTSSQPDSVINRYFNSIGIAIPRIEKWIYNSSGNLTRFIFQQLDPWRIYLYDSTLIDFNVEDFIYEDGLLTKKIRTVTDYYGPYVTEEYYYYNDDGMLIGDSILSDQNLTSYHNYYYYPDGSPEYELEHYASDYLIRKFSYSQTDTSKLTVNRWRFYYGISEQPLLDTVSGWFTESYYYEIYDETGRRTSMQLEQYGEYAENGEVYKAEYGYDDLNHSMHISYYDCIDTTAEGIWKEVLRIDITYNDEGNPITYQKDFYDERTGSWEIENRKDYYYSLVPVAIPYELSEEKILLFPNPASDIIRIKTDLNEDADYTMYTINGLTVGKGKLANHALDISHLESGIYIIEIQDRNSIAPMKFIKY